MTCFDLRGISLGDVYFAIECNNGTTYIVFWILYNYHQCTINLQIIILLQHVSTLLCHPQGARSQYLAKLHKHVKYSCW